MIPNRFRKPLMGVVGALGVTSALGTVFGLWSWSVGGFGALAIWVVGATLVNLLTS